MGDVYKRQDLPDTFCTGSSMMPQKKNPDVPELVRGKTGRVYGHLMGTLTLLKGLPLSYNRDLQEDKEALFDAVDTTGQSLALCTELMRRLVVNKTVLAEAAEGGGMLATELADYLVTKGVPFREAHSITGQIVRFSLEQQRPLQQLTLKAVSYTHLGEVEYVLFVLVRYWIPVVLPPPGRERASNCLLYTSRCV